MMYFNIVFSENQVGPLQGKGDGVSMEDFEHQYVNPDLLRRIKALSVGEYTVDPPSLRVYRVK